MLHRRDAMMRLGQFGLGALALPQLLRQTRASETAISPTAKAKNCILLFLWGGPPQQDMWDPKPEAPDGIRSQFAAIDTSVPGIKFSDQMPLLAKQAQHLAVVRSLTHPSNVHESSCYHMLTGRVNNTLVHPRNQRSRQDFPNVAAIASKFLPSQGLPGSVTLPRPIGHDGVTYAGTHAGFLGPRFDAFETEVPGEVAQPAPHTMSLPDDLSLTRVLARKGLLRTLEQYDRRVQKAPSLAGLDDFRELAYRMLSSPEAKSAFKLDDEPDTMRELYGRNEYGESFLLARRLIESGVRLVTVVWVYICPDGNVANVWDNHGGTGSLGGVTGYQMLKEPYCLPSLDRAYAALLQDLSDRGLLDETLVVSMGEFGRTPQINATMGRDHWGPCQSVTLSGGGIRGGQVFGSSDAHAAYPKDQPRGPEDLLATIYHALGIDPRAEIVDATGRPWRLVEGEPIVELFG